MIRWLVSLVRGPLCRFGSAVGADGCLRAARWRSPGPWPKPLVWCDEHRAQDDVPISEEVSRG